MQVKNTGKKTNQHHLYFTNPRITGEIYWFLSDERVYLPHYKDADTPSQLKGVDINIQRYRSYRLYYNTKDAGFV